MEKVSIIFPFLKKAKKNQPVKVVFMCFSEAHLEPCPKPKTEL